MSWTCVYNPPISPVPLWIIILKQASIDLHPIIASTDEPQCMFLVALFSPRHILHITIVSVFFYSSASFKSNRFSYLLCVLDGWMDVTRRTKSLAAQEVVNWGVEFRLQRAPIQPKDSSYHPSIQSNADSLTSCSQFYSARCEIVRRLGVCPHAAVPKSICQQL